MLSVEDFLKNGGRDQLKAIYLVSYKNGMELAFDGTVQLKERKVLSGLVNDLYKDISLMINFNEKEDGLAAHLQSKNLDTVFTCQLIE